MASNSSCIAVPYLAAPQARNWHIRAEKAGRVPPNYIALHSLLIVNGWFDPEWKFVRIIVVIRKPERKSAPLNTTKLRHPAEKVLDPSFRGAGGEESLFLLATNQEGFLASVRALGMTPLLDLAGGLLSLNSEVDLGTWG